LLLSLLWIRTPAVAAAFSLVRVVCLVANCTFRYATGALAIAIRVGLYTPLVSTSDAGLLLILVCFNIGVSPKEPSESRQLTHFVEVAKKTTSLLCPRQARHHGFGRLD